MTSSKTLDQARAELDKISKHIDTIHTCSLPTCTAGYPIETLRVLIDLIGQVDHRSPVRYQFTQAILSGLDINPAGAGPTPPGVVLEELMKARPITIKALAGLTGLSTKTINDLRKNNVLPTASTALRLEVAGIGTAAQWNRMTSEYKDWMLRQKGNT